jgi:hypothetical protein
MCYSSKIASVFRFGCTLLELLRRPWTHNEVFLTFLTFVRSDSTRIDKDVFAPYCLILMGHHRHHHQHIIRSKISSEIDMASHSNGRTRKATACRLLDRETIKWKHNTGMLVVTPPLPGFMESVCFKIWSWTMIHVHLRLQTDTLAHPASYRGRERLRTEVDLSPLPKSWRQNCVKTSLLSPNVFMAWCSIKQKDIFTSHFLRRYSQKTVNAILST